MVTRSVGGGVGERIAYYRKQQKLSAEELATRAGNGLTRSVLANLENGRKSDLLVSQLMAIAAALNVPVDALISNKSLLRTHYGNVQREWRGLVASVEAYTEALVALATVADRAPGQLEDDDVGWLIYEMPNQMPASSLELIASHMPRVPSGPFTRLLSRAAQIDSDALKGAAREKSQLSLDVTDDDNGAPLPSFYPGRREEYAGPEATDWFAEGQRLREGWQPPAGERWNFDFNAEDAEFRAIVSAFEDREAVTRGIHQEAR